MTGLDLPDLRVSETPEGPISHRAWDGPAGSTFVLVHGLGGSHLNWIQVAPSLAGLGRVLAPDLPGFGTTPLQGRSSGLMDLRRALAAFITTEVDGPVIVAGNSMGGVLGVLQAAVDPASMDGLILTGSAFPWAARGLPSPLVMAGFAAAEVPGLGDALVRARLRRLRPDQVVALGLRLVTAHPDRIPADVVRLHEDLLAAQRDRDDVPRAFTGASRSLVRLARRREVARRALDAVACATLVIHGRRDRFVPTRFAEAELARHPAWRGRILAEVGHAPQMEAPGRWVAEVADWLADRR
ncbi:MAG TPA: alpha/beta hydrolase [Actinomycetota bacterium]|nr:alpha/beta hydrolase [Actinomycetota bacterium]